MLQALKEKWPLLSMSQKIFIIFLLSATFCFLILFTIWFSKPRFTLLYKDVPHGERLRIGALLSGAKIPYRVEDEALFVPDILLEKAYSIIERRREKEWRMYVDINKLMPQYERDCPPFP